MDSKQDENEPSGSQPPAREGFKLMDSHKSIEIDDMTERFSQQQVMITQLKEMVLAEESARSQKLADTRLKVEKYTSQLAKIRERSRGNKSKSSPDTPPSQDRKDVTNIEKSIPKPSRLASETGETVQPTPEVDIGVSPLSSKTNKLKVPSRETTKILHQQIKEHRAIIAERAKNELELEKAILKIQKQLEENQNAEVTQTVQPTANINIMKPVGSDENMESNKIISELRNRIIQLESNVLDLQETCKEKDAVIKSKTDAITLMSADMSKKGKNTLDLLDDTKEQMLKMQENFLAMESNMKSEKNALIAELEVCKNKVIYLEEANSILESERFKLNIENNNLEEKLLLSENKIQSLNSELLDSAKRINELLKIKDEIQSDSKPEEKGIVEIAEMELLSKKVEELEKINSILKQTNTELQEKLNSNKDTEEKMTQVCKEIVIPSASDPDSDTWRALNMVIETLNKQILDIEICTVQKENKIKALQLEGSQPDAIEANIEKTSEIKELMDKIKILEDLNIIQKKSKMELPENPVITKDKSKSPDKNSPQKSPLKSPKQGPKGRKSQKNKQIVEEPKDEPNKELNDMLESINKLSNVIINLNKEINDKKANLLQKEREIETLTFESLNTSKESSPANLKDQFTNTEEKTIENPSDCVKDILKDIVDTVEDLDVDTLRSHLDTANKQIDVLSKDLADANKNMIKLKASHKTKIKQMQKCIDDYSKVSDSNSEVIRLQGEVNSLTQRIAELEDDKGNLQLHLVDYDSDRVSDSQLHAKLLDLERIAEERLKAIADLEMQKFELVQDLHLSKQQVGGLEDKVADLSFLENEHVSAEIKCAQLEEQLELLNSELKSKMEEIDTLLLEKNELANVIANLNTEKTEINTKLELYIQENMDLIDRLDKLSAEKVSSAESIEMVESLTCQEKIEIEQYQKRFDPCDVSEKDIDKTKDETDLPVFQADNSELQSKIELFTLERQEVMEKIENLQIANNDMAQKLKQIMEENKHLDEQYNFVKNEKEAIVSQVNEVERLLKENIELKTELERLNRNKTVTEVVVSETIEIEDTIEKQFIEPPTKELPALADSKQVEETSPAKSVASKGDKKFTKEILRLKNTLKQKDSEITSLNVKITEFTDVNESYNLLFNYFNEANEKLHTWIVENLKTNEPVEIYTKKECASSDMTSINEMIALNDANVIILEEELKKMKNILDIETSGAKQENIVRIDNYILSSLECNISLLNMALSENETEIENFKLDLSKFTNDSDKMNYLCNELQEKIKIVNMIVINNKKEIQDIFLHKNNIEKELTELQRESFNKDEEIIDIKEKLNELNNKLKSCSNFESDIEKIKDECEVYKQNEKDLILKISDLDGRNNEFIVKVEELESQLKLKSDLCNNSELKLSELMNTITGNKDNFEGLQSKINSLQEELHSAQNEYQKLESQLYYSNNSITILEPKVAELQDKVALISSEKEQAVSQVQHLTRENENLLSQNTGLQAKLTDYDSQLQYLSKENITNLEKLEDKMTECENIRIGLSKMASFEDQLNNKQVEIQMLVEQLEGLQSINKELKSAQDAKIQERDGYIESLEIDLNKSKDKISRLENKISLMETLEKKAKKLVMKIQEKDAAIIKKTEHEEELNKKINALEEQVKIYQTQIKDIAEENSEFKLSVNSLNEEKNSLILNMESLKSELNSYESQLEQLHSLGKEREIWVEKCNSLESTMNKMSADYNETIKQKLAEYEYLESILQSQTDSFDAIQTDFKNQYKKLQDELSIQIHRALDYAKEVEELKHEVENLTTEKNNLLEKLQNQQSSQKSSSDLQKQIESLTLLMDEKDAEFQKHQTSAVEYQSELDNSRREVAELSKLKDFISNLEMACLEKDREIQKVNDQFKTCLGQLEEVIGVQQSLKDEQQRLIQEINQKDSLILNLELDLKNMKSLKQDTPFFPSEIIVENKHQQLANASSFFDSWGDSVQTNEDLKYLEDQIVSEESLKKQSANSDLDIPMIRAFHHDPQTPIPNPQVSNVSSANKLVTDEIIQPKKAFVCYNEDFDNVVPADMAIRLSDNSFTQQIPIIDPSLLSKVAELEELIKTLNEEKKKLSADLSQSQAKTNKALIKLKEYKVRNDTLSNEMKKMKNNSEFDILDGAIQDELSSQIKALEEKIKELRTSSEKDKLEKEHMNKRIDVLTSANEKLIVMKEKQDIELQMSMSRNDSLKKKLENLEWGQDFAEHEPVQQTIAESNKEHVEPANKAKIDELVKMNNKLQADIEELESILDLKYKEIENQSAAQKDYELNLESIKRENIHLQEIYEKIVMDKNNLQLEFSSIQQLNDEYKSQLGNQSNDNELESLKLLNQELHDKIENLNKEIIDLRYANETVLTEKDSILSQVASVQSELNELREKNNSLLLIEDKNQTDLNAVLMERNMLIEKLDNLTMSLNNVSQEKETLIVDINNKSSEIEEIKLQLANSMHQIEELKQNITGLENEYRQIECKLKQKIDDLEANYKDILDKFNNETDKNNSNDNELMKKLSEAEMELKVKSNDMEGLKHSYEEKFASELSKYNLLSKEYDDLKHEYNELSLKSCSLEQEINNVLQSFHHIKTEKENLEELVQQKDEDLLKYYNFEAMCNNRFNEYNAILNAKDIDISQKVEEIRILVEQNNTKSSQLEEKILEINVLNEKSDSYDILMQKLSETDDINNIKQSELDDIKIKYEEEKTLIENALSEMMSKVKSLENELKSKVDECISLSDKLQEMQQMVDEEALQMGEMRSALEAQELEIVTLKENLTESISSYGKLQRSLTKAERHVSFSEDTKPGDDTIPGPSNATEKSASPEKPSSRADYDLALYMLHQRDVRCEEMTRELMQLLEERDTLQLKLSDAIRTNEALRRRDSQSNITNTTHDAPTSDPSTLQSAIPSISSQPESAIVDASMDKSLESKLSQLHTVNHMRDVRVKDERETRQRQMDLLQRDVQNLPPEAVAQLREAHYTLSRDTQSTSTVLFNWLWGKTTPKVVHM